MKSIKFPAKEENGRRKVKGVKWENAKGKKKCFLGLPALRKRQQKKQEPSQISTCKKDLGSFASLWQDSGQRIGCFGKIS